MEITVSIGEKYAAFIKEHNFDVRISIERDIDSFMRSQHRMRKMLDADIVDSFISDNFHIGGHHFISVLKFKTFLQGTMKVDYTTYEISKYMKNKGFVAGRKMDMGVQCRAYIGLALKYRMEKPQGGEDAGTKRIDSVEADNRGTIKPNQEPDRTQEHRGSDEEDYF